MDVPRQSPAGSPTWPAGLVWLVGWVAVLALDGRIDLANQALILVLVAAVAALWCRPLVSMVTSALMVLVFNFLFVPPRGTLTVDLNQHVLLLATMLGVSWIVALLMARQRQLAVNERMHAVRADQLRRFGDALRDADDPRDRGQVLQDVLAGLTGTRATLLMLPPGATANAEPDACVQLGEATADERAGLWVSLTRSQALGPGTPRHEDQAALYLPMRGRSASFGAALLPLGTGREDAIAVREHAQALCDQMGAALERSAACEAAAAAREAAQLQEMRNALLAAIAHDHRTPLAAILGAASSLQDQAERLEPEQRRRLAATIVDEAAQLARLTDNTLQLARLDAPGLVLRRDWESVEEIVGTVLRRVRQRDPVRRVAALLDADLPLVRCDAVLMVQMLDNLVDNALRYGGTQAPVEIVARRIAGQVTLAVRDRGPGVPVAWRSRIFEPFQRMGAEHDGERDGSVVRGAGVGLAVCRAIARVHGAELRYRARRMGGASFEFVLPVEVPPAIGHGPREQAAAP